MGRTRDRAGGLSLSACFIGNSFRKVAFLVRFSFSSSVGCLRFACGQILHVNQFISLELKLNQPQRRSLERQRQQFWQLNTNSNFICHLSLFFSCSNFICHFCSPSSISSPSPHSFLTSASANLNTSPSPIPSPSSSAAAPFSTLAADFLRATPLHILSWGFMTLQAGKCIPGSSNYNNQPDQARPGNQPSYDSMSVFSTKLLLFLWAHNENRKVISGLFTDRQSERERGH